jgi:hypothetical protein
MKNSWNSQPLPDLLSTGQKPDQPKRAWALPSLREITISSHTKYGTGGDDDVSGMGES